MHTTSTRTRWQIAGPLADACPAWSFDRGTRIVAPGAVPQARRGGIWLWLAGVVAVVAALAVFLAISWCHMLRSPAQAGVQIHLAPFVEDIVEDARARGGLAVLHAVATPPRTVPTDVSDKDTCLHDAWVCTSGTDASEDASSDVRWLIGWEVPVRNERLKAFASKAFVHQAGWDAAATPVFMSCDDWSPDTYLFMTDEGAVGVLQITGVSDKPHRVNIRYKLISGTIEQDSAEPVLTSDTR